MTREQEIVERFELLWAIGAMITGFRFAFGCIDYALGSLHPEITRFLCGSTLGFTLGGSIAIAGLPLVHGIAGLSTRIFRKGDYGRTESTDPTDAR